MRAWPQREQAARPPEHPPAAALPLAMRDGVATVAVTGDHPSTGEVVSGPLPRAILELALPAVASMLLMTTFTTADAYWIGGRIGAEGLAAVSTSLFWIWQVIALAEMVSVGLTAVAARRHGEGRTDRAAHAVGEGLALGLALGLAVAVIGRLGLDRAFALMQAPPVIAALGRRYLEVYLAGCPLIFGFFAVDAAFRAAGDTRTPFFLLAGSVMLALALDPVLILGLGPAPRIGIAGAAVATVLTRGVAFATGLVLLVRRRMVRLDRTGGDAWPVIVRVGVPTAATGIAFSNIYVLLTRVTTRYGTPALAALGIGHRVESWAFTIGVGCGAAAAAMVGQALGAGRVDRAARAGWVTTGYATAVGGVAALLEFGCAVPFASFFTNDTAVIAESVRYLRVAAVSTMFMGAELVLEGALGGAGATLWPMLTSTTLTAMRLPLAWWAAPRWGTLGIWWVISLTALTRGVAMAGLWRSGVWKGRRV